MSIEQKIRLLAGSFILISLALAVWVNRDFLWFTAFVGANLFQSAITKWCLMEDILKKFGKKDGGRCCCGGDATKQP
jgi:hypothetical protein